jgi:hypothetical protein
MWANKGRWRWQIRRPLQCELAKPAGAQNVIGVRWCHSWLGSRGRAALAPADPVPILNALITQTGFGSSASSIRTAAPQASALGAGPRPRFVPRRRPPPSMEQHPYPLATRRMALASEG